MFKLLFNGKYQKYGITSVTDITKLRKYEKEKLT